jgi:hypothetical protein
MGSVRQIVCASPGYLSQQGRPVSPSDLAGHQCISFFKFGAPAEWAFKMPSGKVQHVQVRTRLVLNSIITGAECPLLANNGPDSS